jgi:hypothetical protein
MSSWSGRSRYRASVSSRASFNQESALKPATTTVLLPNGKWTTPVRWSATASCLCACRISLSTPHCTHCLVRLDRRRTPQTMDHRYWTRNPRHGQTRRTRRCMPYIHTPQCTSANKWPCRYMQNALSARRYTRTFAGSAYGFGGRFGRRNHGSTIIRDRISATAQKRSFAPSLHGR